MIARSRAVDGEIALSASGHVLLPRGIGLSEGGDQQHFLLDTGTLCVLGYYREIPAVRIWNGPLMRGEWDYAMSETKGRDVLW